MKRTLDWGQTPWDDLPHEELLREVQRMYAALVATESALDLERVASISDPASVYWGHEGMGGRALEMARQALSYARDNFDGEMVYRAFFRYANDLLFAPSEYMIHDGWVICDVCRQLVASRYEPLAGTRCGDVLPKRSCDGVLRKFEWRDFTPGAEGQP